MAHWEATIVINLLALAILVALAAWLRSRIPALRRLAIPDAIVAGTLGLLVGPSVLDIVPLSAPDLELVVYHGFAVVFIAVGLQAPRAGPRSGAIKSMSVLIPSMSAVQVVFAFTVVAILAALGVPVHPAFGFLPMLGFAQGPGQALAIGGSWEPLGLDDGAQLGLLFAALGYACCCLVGIPLVAIGRRLGWTETRGFDEDEPVAPPDESTATVATASGVMEPLTAQVVAIGCVYAIALASLWGITSLFPDENPIAATLWGFHFIGAGLIAIAVRRVATRLRIDGVFDDVILARISVLAVDVTTTAALAAVALGVFGGWVVPIIALSLTTCISTLFITLWIARRAFPSRPFEHAVALFGLATGTLPTGLALLRILDPGLRGPVARNLAFGATGSVPLGAPLMLGIMPFAVTLWPEPHAVSLGVPLAIVAAYLVALGFAWRSLTPARWLRPLRTLWPR